MSRLEELLLKWQNADLTDDEPRELNAMLNNCECRRQLSESFVFDARLVEALASLHAVKQAAKSAQDFGTLEAREAEPFEDAAAKKSEKPKIKWMPEVLGKRWLRLAAAIVTLGLLAILVLGRSADDLAVIEGSTAGVTIWRGSQARTPRAGLALKRGDRVKTAADGSVSLRYVNESTRIKLQGGTQLAINGDSSGKKLELMAGALSARVARQPSDRPMLIATPQADAKILGTEFLLSVDNGSTRLEVVDGTVQIYSREDGKTVVVGRDHYATVGRGADLASRPVLPAPWNSQDIGAVGMTGYARIEGEKCKIKAAGKPDAKSKDQFHFLYQTLEGDGEIRARVVDVELTHNLAKAGVLIRDNLKPASAHAFLYLNAGSGLEFEHRGQSETKVSSAGSESSPSWVRLLKAGEWIFAYKSTDGINWTEVGSDRIKMKGKVYLGLGVSSWNNSKLATSIFDNVRVISAGTNSASAAPNK